MSRRQYFAAALLCAALLGVGCSEDSSGSKSGDSAGSTSTPGGTKTANVQIVNQPSPVPWSGAPVNNPVCAGISETWMFNTVLTEIGGVDVTFTTTRNTIDMTRTDEFQGMIKVEALKSVTLPRAFCFNDRNQHTIVSTFSGTDANGSPVSVTAPAARLQPRP